MIQKYNKNSIKTKKMLLNEKEVKEMIQKSMDHVKLRSLKQKIGHGYSKKIQEYILKETRKRYHEVHIRRSFMLKTMNPMIIYFALEYVKKQEEMISEEVNTLNDIKDVLNEL